MMQYSHLLFSKEVIKTLSKEKRITQDSKLARKIAKALDNLNDFGTDHNYHPKGNLETLANGWWSLRIRHQKDYWRIIFRKTTSSKYGLTIMFLKKENKISKKHWDAAKNVAKREGWL